MIFSIKKTCTFLNTNEPFSCIYKSFSSIHGSFLVSITCFLIFLNTAFTNIRKSFINTRNLYKVYILENDSYILNKELLMLRNGLLISINVDYL